MRPAPEPPPRPAILPEIHTTHQSRPPTPSWRHERTDRRAAPYLVAKMKAPRIQECLAITAERARAEGWAHEQFLEALLEAEVFARDASGARSRPRPSRRSDCESAQPRT